MRYKHSTYIIITGNIAWNQRPKGNVDFRSKFPNIFSSYLPSRISLIYQCHSVLTFFFLLQKGAKAPQAAGTIHSDFEKFFIQAEIQAYADFKELGSEAAVRYVK